MPRGRRRSGHCHRASPRRPEGASALLPGFNPANYRKRQFARWSPAGHTPKCLRDTYASQLLTAGVPIGFISNQLGHEDAATTARHYARWIPQDADDPPRRVAGDVWADLLAKLTSKDGVAEAVQLEDDRVSDEP